MWVTIGILTMAAGTLTYVICVIVIVSRGK